jgi:hypothetical protein
LHASGQTRVLRRLGGYLFGDCLVIDEFAYVRQLPEPDTNTALSR